MALSLANMLARVKRIVPTTTLDTELQDHLLERMNYLTTLDTFPFQEGYQSATLAAGDSSMATPDNFAAQRSLVIYTAGSERTLEYLDAISFDGRFPNPSNRGAAKPTYYTIKVAESSYYFDCPADAAYTLYNYFYKIPDSATDTTVSQMTEMAKITLIDWAASDGFRDMKEFDRADHLERSGDKKLMALRRRYQLAREEGARFISAKEQFLGYKGY
jgi:hypothetical protein